ncbi:2,3-bisphosphoglycerate-dependent phosphoglycerate mutase [Plakobranchus ocellatus]|uniref:phosphoglycerate mutase (2,3-diphosphoglycerate-dependent) n=1 Tax=Plakobranchus ocellatus TaxID=259542 RepID=A0AAV3YMZ3_9GAST|nr:2,3-bisphosphoglycerate-dependent phosphoglycerate mutase [Plakobranchus ocellatus]
MHEQQVEQLCLLHASGLDFDVAFTSVLKRAVKTLYFIQEEMDAHWLPVVRSWRLNEKHQGALQGCNKKEMAALYGEPQLKVWRRSFTFRPPPLEDELALKSFNPKPYAGMDISMLPKTESLKDTLERLLPCWYDQIAPALKSNKKVLLVGHGSSVRAIIKFLEDMPDDEFINLEVPQAIPLVYKLDDDLRPLKHYYLGTEKELEAGLAKVAARGKAKVFQDKNLGKAAPFTTTNAIYNGEASNIYSKE